MKQTSRWAGLCVILLAGVANAAPPATQPTTRPSSSHIAPATMPTEAVVNFVRAIETGDKALFLATVDVPPQDRDFVEAELPGLFALAAWTRQMTDAYGPDALKGQFFSHSLPKPDQLAGKLVAKESGETATVTGSAEMGSVEVVMKAGGWFVAMSEGEIPPPGQREQKLHGMRAAAAAFKEVQPKIGKPGYDAPKLIEELNKAMKKHSHD